MPNPLNLPLSARYRTALGMTATEAAAIITGESSHPLKLEAQQKLFGEALDGKKARVVLIAAGRSKNGNVYSPELLAASAEMFEGVKVFYNHRGSYQRDARDLAGEITNIKWNKVDEQLEGTFTTLSTDVYINSLLKEAPHLVEFSVFLWCYSTGNEDGSETVEKIIKVQSVDIVHEAAAGGKVLQVLEEAIATSPDLPAKVKTEDVKEPKTEDSKDGDSNKKLTEAAEKEAARKEQDAMTEAELKQTIENLKSEKTELQLKLDAKKEADAVALKTAQDVAIALEAKNAKLENANVLATFLAAHPDMKPSITEAVKSTAGQMDTITAEKLEAVRAEWTAKAEAFAKDFAPAAAPAPATPAPGLPPKTENAPAPAAGEEAPKTKTESARDMIFRTMGVEI